MTILDEANKAIKGERREAYGPVTLSFQRVASMWSVILGQEVSKEQVALMMIAFKLARETNLHKRDNLVDIAGYADLTEQLYELPKTKIRSVRDIPSNENLY